MKRLFCAATVGFCLALAGGCIAVDSRVSEEVPAPDSATAIAGRFVNEPSYRSHRAGLAGPGDLGEMFGAPTTGTDGELTIGKFKVDAIEFALDSGRGLSVSYIRAGKVVGQSVLLFNDGLVLKNGKFEMHKAGCGGGDSEQGGCSTGSNTFFVNTAGELVVVSAGSGAGFVTIVPMAIHANLMSIYPRVH